MADFDVGLGLEGTHVIVTGAAGQIGQGVVEAFLSAGAYVSGFDINESRMTMVHDRLFWQAVDVTDQVKLETAFEQSKIKFGIVSTCIAAAGLDLSFIPHHASICDLPLEQWQKTIAVNTTGVFLTARAWLRAVRDNASHMKKNVALTIIGSEAGVLGVPGNADYATSKAAIQYGLNRSLAPEAARVCRTARVNAIAPGAVNTPQFQKECNENQEVLYQDSEATVAIRESVPIEAVARTCLMLSSDNFSSHTTGQIIRVDGGKNGRLLWSANGTPTW